MKLMVILILISLISCVPIKEEEWMRLEMPMERYNFIREVYAPDDLEFLMGNGEMGGWARKDGLGFENLWFTDVWEDSVARKSFPGPKLTLLDQPLQDSIPETYRTELNIRNGILTTHLTYKEGEEYESTIFFSKTNKHLLLISIRNESPIHDIRCLLKIPEVGFNISQIDRNILQGSDPFSFTKTVWHLKADVPVKKINGEYRISIAPHKRVTIIYSLVTHFDSSEYVSVSAENIEVNNNFEQFIQEQEENWDNQWSGIASVILPDGENAKWFYRSLYTLYATAGADKFLPGELQFSIPDPDWKMHHFTYGHAGWSVWAFAMMGDREHAVKMAKWHFKPDALKENVRILFPETGPVELIYQEKSKGMHTYLDSYNPDAMAFGHEVSCEGYNITYPNTKHWDLQRHTDAFGTSLFHIISHYYPDNEFLVNYTYPVMKGTAEMWSSLAGWDSLMGYYYLPPLLSVSENIMEKSVLDAVLAARWNLKMSAGYAKKLDLDKKLQDKWMHIYEHLYVPQNDTIYLEYLEDDQSRSGGGYFGIRAPMYFGFPVLENIPDINMDKARRSLDITWGRNRQGEGMISFILNWFASTEAYLGNGNNAFKLSLLTTTLQDPSGVALCEVQGYNPYFLTGYSSFILSQLSMLLQSFNDTIRAFPALPDEWEDVEFYDLPAQGGVKVSGIMRSGKVNRISFDRDGKTVLELDQNLPVRFNPVNHTLEIIEAEKSL
ncbi:MAG: hypothetical protein AMS26_11775 [Bacteroides sp. SM23_62]|nr:MAG: hypothetical protein AMS26_11775 [Bacteroides sp. SM23_62]